MPKHGWYNLDNYVQIHEKILRFFSKYMRSPKIYTWTWVGDAKIYLEAECNGIEFITNRDTLTGVSIRKSIFVDRSNPKRPRAKTTEYTYHAYDLQSGR